MYFYFFFEKLFYCLKKFKYFGNNFFDYIFNERSVSYGCIIYKILVIVCM